MSHIFRPPSSGMKFLGSVEIDDDATVDIDNTIIRAPYKNFIFILNSIKSATNEVNFSALLSNDNGSSFHVTGYESYGSIAGTGYAATTSTVDLRLTQGTPGNLSLGNAVGRYWNGVITLYDPLGASTFTYMSTVAAYARSAVALNIWSTWCSGTYEAAAEAHNAIRFQMSSGNITSGTISVYGIGE